MTPCGLSSTSYGTWGLSFVFSPGKQERVDHVQAVHYFLTASGIQVGNSLKERHPLGKFERQLSTRL